MLCFEKREKTSVVYHFFNPPVPVLVNYRHWPVGILVYHFGITSALASWYFLVYHFGITVHVIFCLSYGFH